VWEMARFLGIFLFKADGLGNEKKRSPICARAVDALVVLAFMVIYVYSQSTFS